MPEIFAVHLFLPLVATPLHHGRLFLFSFELRLDAVDLFENLISSSSSSPLASDLIDLPL